VHDEKIRSKIQEACIKHNFICDNYTEDKAMQLYNLFLYQMGLILVGPAGSGKSTSLKTLIQTIEIINPGVVVDCYNINPKAINKVDLYGHFDENTDIMHDGILTKTIRKTLDSNDVANRFVFIILDGDIDPVWAENLNSVLDDSKLFTLSNGERMNIPRNFRFIFEVQDLRYTTNATISRCGLSYYSDLYVNFEVLY
jgi:dynein heavy chain 1